MIRKAKLSDLKILTKVFIKEYSVKPYNEKWSEKRAYEKIKNYYKQGQVFVLLIKNKVEGFVICHEIIWDWGNQGFIDELAVSKKFQGNGYGKKLFQHAEEYFRRRGIRKVALMSNTKSKAYNIYKKWGYKEENYVSMVRTLK